MSLLAQAAAGSPQVFEWQARDRAGRVFWVEVHLKPIRLEGRDHVLAVLRDIDQRKQAEEALEKSKTHYQALFEDSPISLWQEDLTDLRAYFRSLQDAGVRDVRAYFEAHPEEVRQCANLIKVVDINRTTLEMYEADSKEQLLTTIASTFSPESYPAFKEAIIALAEGQTWFETETVTTTLTGKKNHILLRLRVLPGSENAGNEVSISIVDITASKRAAEALQTQTRVLESMAEGVMVTDADGKIIYSNPAFDAMFGYQPGELIGQPASRLNDFSASEGLRVCPGNGRAVEVETHLVRGGPKPPERRNHVLYPSPDQRPGNRWEAMLGYRPGGHYRAPAGGGGAAAERSQLPDCHRRVSGGSLCNSRWQIPLRQPKAGPGLRLHPG